MAGSLDYFYAISAIKIVKFESHLSKPCIFSPKTRKTRYYSIKFNIQTSEYYSVGVLCIF